MRTYGPAYIPLASKVRDEARGVQAQPPRLQAQSTHILFELSDSPFHSPSCLTARLQAGYPPDVSNSPPVGNLSVEPAPRPAARRDANHQTAGRPRSGDRCGCRQACLWAGPQATCIGPYRGVSPADQWRRPRGSSPAAPAEEELHAGVRPSPDDAPGDRLGTRLHPDQWLPAPRQGAAVHGRRQPAPGRPGPACAGGYYPPRHNGSGPGMLDGDEDDLLISSSYSAKSPLASWRRRRSAMSM